MSVLFWDSHFPLLLEGTVDGNVLDDVMSVAPHVRFGIRTHFAHSNKEAFGEALATCEGPCGSEEAAQLAEVMIRARPNGCAAVTQPSIRQHVRGATGAGVYFSPSVVRPSVPPDDSLLDLD